MRDRRQASTAWIVIVALSIAAAVGAPRLGAQDSAEGDDPASASAPAIAATIEATIRASLDASRRHAEQLASQAALAAERSDDPLVFLAHAVDVGMTRLGPDGAARLDAARAAARDDPIALTLLAAHCAGSAPSRPPACPPWPAAERLTDIEPGNGFAWLLRAIDAETDDANRGAGRADADREPLVERQTAHLRSAASTGRFDSHWADMLLRFVDFYRRLDTPEAAVSAFDAILLATDRVNRVALPPQYPWLFRACEPTTAGTAPQTATAIERRAACQQLAYQMAERGTAMVDAAIGIALMKKLGGVEAFGDDLARIERRHQRLAAAEADCPSWRSSPFETPEGNRLGEEWIEAVRAGGEVGALEERLARC